MMVTDAWVRPGNPVAHIPGQLSRRLAERYHPDLESAEVRDLTLSLVRHEVEWRLQRRAGWDALIARNEWFQNAAANLLAECETRSSERIAVFAHSYSAGAIFRLAKQRGWLTVLGQIDPGEEHFAMVRRLADAAPQYGAAPLGPPIEYFARWREECALADHIVVNSEWSREAVTRAGVAAARLRVLPLAYEGRSDQPAPPHVFPESFTSERPLRLLFVGSVSVVKGAAALLEAMTLVAGLPVTLRLVGEPGMVIPPRFPQQPAIEFVGAVPRGEIGAYYASSDALVFPSHSDGFGMAQIEAQAVGLPIIASRSCGRVVENGVNGVLLPEVTADAIATAIRSLVARPAVLAHYASHAITSQPSALTQLGAELVGLVEA
jgi:glycosyltransferase involved in cell wall biosynthesis